MLRSPAPPLLPEIPGLSQRVRAVKEILPLADLGPFGLPAAAMIVNNATAKLVLGWKNSGAGWPRPDLEEGAFNPPPEGRSGGAGFAPGLGSNGVPAGLPRGGDRLRGNLFPRAQGRCIPASPLPHTPSAALLPSGLRLLPEISG